MAQQEFSIVRMNELVLSKGSSCRQRPGGGWAAQTGDGRLLALDDNLLEISAFAVPPSTNGAHGVSRSGDLALLSLQDRYALVDNRGQTRWELLHTPWGQNGSESGCAAFDGGDEHAFVTVPSKDAPDQWLTLDVATGEVLASAQLDCFAQGSEAIHHPNGQWIGLCAGEGQDGSNVYWARYGNSLDFMSLNDPDRVLAAIHPDGTSFLATPHDGQIVTIHSFPDGLQTAQITNEALEDEELFDLDGCFVDAKTALVKVAEDGRHCVLDTETLALQGHISYPSLAERGIVGGGDGTWLTLSWPEGVLTRWTFSS
jgi:hypothetical protein